MNKLLRGLQWLKLAFFNYWHRIGAFIAFVPIAVRLFLRATPLAISLASIPLDKYVTQPFVATLGLGQVSARLLGFALTFVLMFVAWHFGELIVALVALAMVQETYLLMKCILNRINEQKEMAASVASA